MPPQQGSVTNNGPGGPGSLGGVVVDEVSAGGQGGVVVVADEGGSIPGTGPLDCSVTRNDDLLTGGKEGMIGDVDDDDLKQDQVGGGLTDGHGHSAAGNISHSWGRGIIYDFNTTIRKYWFTELINFNTKTIAVSLFLFIAVIAPSITFGAVYAKRTNNYMGAVELLLGTAWCGIFYSLTSGMPMMINGGTGPVLTFQAVTYELSKNWDIPFLTFNAWIGIWVSIYMLLSAFFDLNRFIKYATRFTDEIFAFLIISIFILDAIGNPASKVGLLHYFNPDHKHHKDAARSYLPSQV